MEKSESRTNILTDTDQPAVSNVNHRNQVNESNSGPCSSAPESENNAVVSTVSPDSRNMVVHYTSRRARISVAILCFINLINYMDRYTLAGNSYLILNSFEQICFNNFILLKIIPFI